MTHEQKGIELLGRLIHIRQTAQKMIEQMKNVQQLFIEAEKKNPESEELKTFTKGLSNFFNAEMDAARMITKNVDCFLNQKPDDLPAESDDVDLSGDVCGVHKYPHIHPGRMDWFNA